MHWRGIISMYVDNGEVHGYLKINLKCNFTNKYVTKYAGLVTPCEVDDTWHSAYE